MDSIRHSPWLPVSLAATILLFAAGLYQFFLTPYQNGLLFGSIHWLLVFLVAVAGLLTQFGLLVAVSLPSRRHVEDALQVVLHFMRRFGKWNLAFFLLAIVAYSYLIIGRFGYHLEQPYARFAFFWLAALFGTLFLRASGLERSWPVLLAASLLLYGMIFRSAAFLSDVTTYPFSLGWSEASRFYYASLFFSKRIYGISVPPSVLHPSRYLMQSIPFLIPNTPLWFHRLWQSILWVATAFATGWFLARRLDIKDRLVHWMLVSWAFLFVLLGPVYYHLMVPLIIVLWGFHPNREGRSSFLRNLLVVLLASAWAGISRVNWFPVPGMLAACLYFLEKPTGERRIWRYLIPPFLWALSGIMVAFGAQAIYAFWSGNPTGEFTSSFSSDLLWYRLLPSATYPPGILLASLFVSLPLLVLIWVRLKGNWHAYHPLRLIGIGGALFVLYAGGLVVSTKIGGGSNLHNLDAYLGLLMIVAAVIYFGRFRADRDKASQSSRVQWPALALAILIPLYGALLAGGPLYLPTQDQVEANLKELTSRVQTVVDNGGEVLFITERHLLTFNILPGVPLSPDYEKVFLMEMAMANNPNYLGRFQNDIKNHRFALIVTEPLFVKYKDSSEPFGEENNAWAKNVAEPVLCSYQQQKRIRPVDLQLLVPDPEGQDCP